MRRGQKLLNLMQGECKDFMITYMQCLKKNKNMNFNCRAESQAYLQCRMDRELMAKEDLAKLGFRSSAGTDAKQSSSNQRTSDNSK
ncbi:cytochrome c oxidase assembly protein COX19 isoform X3 [Nematostella vectensis]|nr:cytochrome c oxidase assembly protein COX19 isoform X3 [Nematostella vectensis]